MSAPFRLARGGPGLGGDLTDAPIEAVGEGLVQGGAVDGVVVFAGAGVGNEGVEGVVGAVVGRHDPHLAAPHGHRHGGLEEFIEVVDKCRLVNDDAIARPALGAQVARVVAEGADVVAGGELDVEDMNVAVVLALEDGFADGAQGGVESFGPARASWTKVLVMSLL